MRSAYYWLCVCVTKASSATSPHHKFHQSYLLHAAGSKGFKDNRWYAPYEGAYYCFANVRMDNGGRGYYFKLLIALDGTKDSHNGLSTMEGNMGSNNYRNMNVAGTLVMKANQYASIFVYTNGDNSWVLDDESGFGCHYLITKVGFHADLGKSYTFNTGWHTFVGWRSSGSTTLYTMGNGFTAAGYTAPSTGYYVCTANMRFDSSSSTGFYAVIAIDDDQNMNNGLSSVSGARDSSNYRDLTVAGTVRLRKGDSVSVHVYSANDNSWTVHSESGDKTKNDCAKLTGTCARTLNCVIQS